MIIANRNRSKGHGKTYVKNNTKLPLNFDLASLDLLCNFVISENRNIRRLQYINLRNLMEMLDMERYISDQERYKRVLFIKKGLEARLEKNLQDHMMILKYINGGIIDNDIIDISDFKDMSNAEIDWINETVSNALKYSFIYERQDAMIDMWQRFKSSDYRNTAAIVSEIEAATSESIVGSPAFHIPEILNFSLYCQYEKNNGSLFGSYTFSVEMLKSIDKSRNGVVCSHKSKEKGRYDLSGNGSFTSEFDAISCRYDYRALGNSVDVISMQINYR